MTFLGSLQRRYANDKGKFFAVSAQPSEMAGHAGAGSPNAFEPQHGMNGHATGSFFSMRN